MHVADDGGMFVRLGERGKVALANWREKKRIRKIQRGSFLIQYRNKRKAEEDLNRREQETAIGADA